MDQWTPAQRSPLCDADDKSAADAVWVLVPQGLIALVTVFLFAWRGYLRIKQRERGDGPVDSRPAIALV